MTRPALSILTLLFATTALANEGRYIVTFKDAAQGRTVLYAAGGRPVLELGPQNAVAAMLPEQAAAALANNPAIELVEIDPPRRMLSQQQPYGIGLVQAPQVWPLATGANRKVCIIDSGFNVGHEDLQGTAIDGYPADWNVDTCGHGTHVAGTIAALDNGSGVVGVLPNGVNLHIIKVFGGSDCAWTYASTLVDALNRCQAAGSDVVSMSLGGGRKSRTEENAFKQAWTDGVLSVAAAGNDGNSTFSYPASYASVISVAAVDAARQRASFSQYNNQVDLAAPGVQVLSTVPWIAEASLTVDGAVSSGSHIEGSATTAGVTGPLAFGGLCDSTGAWAGQVVLCQRGTISFADKVKNVEAGGGVAAVIYNNIAGGFAGTMNGTATAIAGIGLSQADGEQLVANSLGLSGTVLANVTPNASGYEGWDGTSMATPHVSAVAALVWSYNPAWTNQQVRDALEQTAEDLGAPGRDNEYGFGLVRAKAALDSLVAPPPPPPPPTTSITLTVTASQKRKFSAATLEWSGATGATVDVYRDGALLASPSNTGSYTDRLDAAAGTFSYRVCNAGTAECSPDASVTF